MLIKIKEGRYINPEKVESLHVFFGDDLNTHTICVDMDTDCDSFCWGEYSTREEAVKALDELAELINKAN